MSKRRWADMSPGARRLVVLGSIAEFVLTSVALRDLRSRPASLVRGSKWLWRAVTLVQPVGPIAYLLVGRRGTGAG